MTDVETRPMMADELGRYVCVPADACLKGPDLTIRSDGLWVKTGQLWSSAHRGCFSAAHYHPDCVSDPDFQYSPDAHTHEGRTGWWKFRSEVENPTLEGTP